MTAAIVILAVAGLIGLGANPVARWFARADADIDRLVADTLDDGPDLEGNPDWWNSQGRSQLR